MSNRSDRPRLLALWFVVLAGLAVVGFGPCASAQGDKGSDEAQSWANRAQATILKQVQALQVPCKKKKHCERGVATVAFVAGRGGEVNQVTIAKSSGSSTIDTMAVDAVRRSAPLPPFPSSEPDDVHTRPVQINIRVN